MRMIVVFVPVLILAVIAFFVFSYISEVSLGIILAVLMLACLTAFLLVIKFMEKRNRKSKEEKDYLKQDVIDGQEHQKPSEENKEGELLIPPKKDANLNATKEELEMLKKASDVLDEEKQEGMLSEDIYNELKKQNKEAIEKLEQEIAKASGETQERMIYCRKGKHYISERDCIPSKISGYVICQEHNEEIRVE